MAHHRHPAGIGRPHREIGAGNALSRGGMGAHVLVGPQQSAFRVEVVIELAEDGPEPVGVHQFHGIAPAMHPEAVGKGLASPGQVALEDTFRMDHGQIEENAFLGPVQEFHAGGPGQEGAKPQAFARNQVHPEPRTRVQAISPQEGPGVEAVEGGKGHQDSGKPISVFSILATRLSHTRNASVTDQAWASQPLA